MNQGPLISRLECEKSTMKWVLPVALVPGYTGLVGRALLDEDKKRMITIKEYQQNNITSQ